MAEQLGGPDQGRQNELARKEYTELKTDAVRPSVEAQVVARPDAAAQEQQRRERIAEAQAAVNRIDVALANNAEGAGTGAASPEAPGAQEPGASGAEQTIGRIDATLNQVAAAPEARKPTGSGAPLEVNVGDASGVQPVEAPAPAAGNTDPSLAQPQGQAPGNVPSSLRGREPYGIRRFGETVLRSSGPARAILRWGANQVRKAWRG